MSVVKKVKLEKRTRKDFAQGTVVIQTPSFTTSTDYGYFLHLCSFPLSKTSIFKISETLLHRGSANHCTIVNEFSGITVSPVLRVSGPLGRRGPAFSKTPPYEHQHGGRKPAETSVTDFCDKSVSLSVEDMNCSDSQIPRTNILNGLNPGVSVVRIM